MSESRTGQERQEPRHVDAIVRGSVVTMNPAREIIAAGAVAVDGSAIVAVGPRNEIESDYMSDRLLGDDRSIVIPGFIDCHTHCSQCFVRSLTVDELPPILRIYVPGQSMVGPDEARATVRLIAAQLLRSGVTTLCEGNYDPAHDEPIVETLEEIGIRCCMARGTPDQDIHHAALYSQQTDRSWLRERKGEAARDLKRTQAFLERFPPDGKGLLRGAINASDVLNMSETYFKEAFALARQHGATMQVHLDRDREEVETSMALWGCRPIERLAELGVIDEHLVAIHAVLASGAEIRLLAQGGASLAHSAIECVGNLNGVPDVQRFRLAGIPVGLGCDNQCNDMFATLRGAWVMHGAVWGIPRYDPSYLSAQELFAMATIEAARVLRWADRIGSLEPGKAADLVVIDGKAPHLMARQDLISELVKYGSRAEVTHVMVDGRLLLDDGRHTTIDLERLYHDAKSGAEHMRKALQARRYRPMPSQSGILPDGG